MNNRGSVGVKGAAWVGSAFVRRLGMGDLEKSHLRAIWNDPETNLAGNWPNRTLTFPQRAKAVNSIQPSSVLPPRRPTAAPHGPDAECGLFTDTGDDSDNDPDDPDSDADEN